MVLGSQVPHPSFRSASELGNLTRRWGVRPPLSSTPPLTIVKGGHVCGPAWVRENQFLPVEAERGILCCPHTESLEGSPGKTLDSVQQV